MTDYHRRLCPGDALLLAVLALSGACVSEPAPLVSRPNFPVDFETVWYRPTKHRAGFNVVTDTGRIVVRADGVEFTGSLTRLYIPCHEVTELKFGKLGLGLVNNWIQIAYGSATAPATAFFTAGEAHGWAGGSDEIYQVIEWCVNAPHGPP